MSTVKFSTFGNNSKSSNPFPSTLLNQPQSSPKETTIPFTNIPQLKKEMQDVINSKKSSQVLKEILNKYPSEISMMKSNISMISANGKQFDFPLSLFKLQVDCTQELLALREDQITLMEQKNKLTGERYKIERELAKIRNKTDKQRQSISAINELIEFQKQNSNSKKKFDKKQIIARNDQLKLQYQLQAEKNYMIPERQQQEQLLLEIESMHESVRTVEDKINKMEINAKREQNDKKIDISINKNIQSKVQPTQNQIRKVIKYRKKREMLLRTVANMTSKLDLRKYFQELIRQNNQLNQKNDQMCFGYRKFSPLQQTKQQLQNEQQQKKLFLQDMIRFQENLRQLKVQNQNLKRSLKINDQLSN